MKKLLACTMAMLMMTSAALAEGKSYEGKVVSTETVAVLASAAGTVAEVRYQAGERVRAGDEVAVLRESTVYAEQSGTVRVFGGEGESVDTVTARYGAVVYLEPAIEQTLTGNTSYAYDKAENKVIHPGETVYLRSATTAVYEGVGLVTALNGSKYTVEVISGNLLDSQIVYIYRDPAYTAASRIGRGTVNHADPVSITGTGVISRILVRDGARVEAGTPLFTTVDAAAYSAQMAAPADGVISAVSVSAGTAVEANALIAEIYPDSARRLELIVEGRDLRSIRVGLPVEITFDNGVTASGAVERISGVPYIPESTGEDDDTVYFAVYVTFQSGESIPYGMAAKAVVLQ